MSTSVTTPVGTVGEIDTVVTDLSGAELFSNRIPASMRVADIKLKLRNTCGIPTATQRILVGDTVLADAELISGYRCGDSVLALHLIILSEEITHWLQHLESTPRGIMALVFRSLETSVRDCFECALCAVRKDGAVLEFLSSALQCDKRIVLAAVSQKGASIQFASHALRCDREVVISALKTCGMALKYAPENLRQERDIVDVAINQDVAAIEYVDEALRRDVSFRLFYAWIWLGSDDGVAKMSMLAAVLSSFFLIAVFICILKFTDHWQYFFLPAGLVVAGWFMCFQCWKRATAPPGSFEYRGCIVTPQDYRKVMRWRIR
eukprot:TRINITY_DN56781_c0_g1_i1.p1 TRINITY_DN56781_c0_g1~~TRINITY_DN56781_c0_g1_i1.p1  ORF type:complete len:321 (-),score=28.16 TRINITY_DN56781_c0_g1_i1:117-1079(-)